jgi:hypothetical protein
MNCGTFSLAPVAKAISDIIKNGTPSCHNCGFELSEVTRSRKGYLCPGCDAAVCVVCGCTENRACAEGCSWISPGLCSTHV